jgi:hypothetical protein
MEKNYDNATKLAREIQDSNIITENSSFRSTGYADKIITVRNKAAATLAKQYISLADLFKKSSGQNHKQNCCIVCSDLLDVDGYTMSEDPMEMEDFLIKVNPVNSYKEERKKNIPVVQFNGQFSSNNDVIETTGIVVIDVDLKVFMQQPRGLLLSSFENYKQSLKQFYLDHPSSIFCLESLSSTGFHIGFATTASNRPEFKNAFLTIVDQFKSCMEFTRIPKVLDTNSASFSSAYFLGYNSNPLFKEPEQIIEVPKITPPQSIKREKTEGLYAYDDDLRLSLAFKKRDPHYTYFDSYDDWSKMAYHLYCTFFNNKDRAMYWFQKLSALSPVYKGEDDDKLLDSVFNDEPDIYGGVNAIIAMICPNMPRYSEYTVEEIMEYFETAYDYDVLNFVEPDIYIDRYIHEAADELDLFKNCVIQSPPNTGKSTFLLNQEHQKIIYLVPNIVLLNDLKKKREDAFIVKGGVAVEEIPDDCQIVLGTYNSIFKIRQCKMLLQEYTLVVDEAHEIFCSSSLHFRYDVMREVIDQLHRFNNFIFLSGTWIDFPFTHLDYEIITVAKTVPDERILELNFTPTPLNRLVYDLKESHSKQICLINHKDLNEEVKGRLQKELSDYNPIIINADTKNDDEVQKILAENRIENSKIIVTQIFRDGVSLLNEDITHLRFYQHMLPEHIAQFIFRVRSADNPPKLIYYFKKENYRLQEKSDYQVAYDSLLTLSENVDYGSLVYTTVKENNFQTCKDSQGKYYPMLLYAQGQPTIDNLLLANQTLDDVHRALRNDLFGLLCHLRKWNFKFVFTSSSSHDILTAYRRQNKHEQEEMIKNDFEGLINLHINAIPARNTMLKRAIACLQWVDPAYFIQMPGEQRLKLFSTSKSFKLFVEQIAAEAILNKLESDSLNDYIRSLGLGKNLILLKQTLSAPGYPSKIYHYGLEMICNLKIRAIKAILKDYLEIGGSTVDQESQRFFAVERKAHPFNDYILWKNFQVKEDNPFY